MKYSIKIMGLMAGVFLAFGFSASAQIDQNWGWELELGTAKSITNPNQTRFHVGVLLPAKKDYRWHRINFALVNEFYPQHYYQNDPSVGLVQDSGFSPQMHLTYGLEARTYKSDIVAIYAGGEIGGAVVLKDRTTNTWANSNLNESPAINRTESTTFRAMINPYVGMKVWLSDRIGVFGEGWAMTSLYTESDATSSTFNFDQSMEFRVGMTFKMGMN